MTLTIHSLDADSDEQLLEYYLDWTDDAIAEMDTLVAAAKTAPSEDTNQKIYEISHNIKGMGTSFGFPLITEAGRSLCGYLRKRGERELDYTLVETHIKSFRLILSKRLMADGGTAGHDLVNRLNQLVDHVLAS